MDKFKACHYWKLLKQLAQLNHFHEEARRSQIKLVLLILIVQEQPMVCYNGTSRLAGNLSPGGILASC